MGVKIGSLALREEHRLRVFENSMLRRISGLKKGEIIDGWRKLLSKELHNLYSSPNIIVMISEMEDEMGGACSTYGETRNAYI
jgi:hypothetical protein